MNYFDINIDNDITYLLQQIGHNVKVNNVPARAIVNNASMERTFDDKRIITHEELKRGLYVNYNDLWFLVLNEVNDKRYLTYYKGIIRRCNFDLQFIIKDILYKFPSIVEGDKFFISDNGIMLLSADTVTVTLPLTDVTQQIKKLDAFIKWGSKWEVQGMDYTKSGLVVLTCKATAISDVTDDKVNEIANRYTNDKDDKLNGNITPLMPFDEPPKPAPNIVSVKAIDNVVVDYGTAIEDIELPSIVTAKLDDGTTIDLVVAWDTSSYDGEVTAVYTLPGTLQLVEGITNTNNVMASLRVAVGEEPEPTEEITYTMTAEPEYQGVPDYEIFGGEWCKYTVHKFVNDVEVDGDFYFAINNDKLAILTKENNNTAKVTAKKIIKTEDLLLTATDTATKEIAIEKVITILGR